MSARATEEDGENHIRAYGVEPSAFNGRDQFVWMVYKWFTEKWWFMAPVHFAVGRSKMLLKLFCNFACSPSHLLKYAIYVRFQTPWLAHFP